MGIFSAAKDRLTERAALSYLNSRVLGSAGKVTALRIDSTARTVELTVELKGEATPVQVVITEYELSHEAERYFVTVKEVRTTREWLTILAKERLCQQRIELPADAGRLLMAAL